MACFEIKSSFKSIQSCLRLTKDIEIIQIFFTWHFIIMLSQHIHSEHNFRTVSNIYEIQESPNRIQGNSIMKHSVTGKEFDLLEWWLRQSRNHAIMNPNYNDHFATEYEKGICRTCVCCLFAPLLLWKVILYFQIS